MPRLTWIRRIQWSRSFFSFLEEKYSFGDKFDPLGPNLPQKEYFRSKTEKVNTTIEIPLKYTIENPEIPFLSKFGPKNKIVSSSWNLVLRLIRLCRIQCWRSLFPLSTGNTIFGQIWSQNWKIVSSSWNDLNMQNSMVVFTFSVLERKYSFWGKFGSKIQNCQFKLKSGTKTNSNMQNSMMMLYFSVFDWNYPFWANLVKKIKGVRLNWN